MKNAPIAGRPSRRIRRTPSEIAAILDEYRSSGLTQRAYVLSKGICRSTFGLYLRRARDGEAIEATEPPRLIPVKITESPDGLGSGSRAFQLFLRGGHRLAI